jgi:DNA-binding transcriptional LysR family regulator
MLDELDVTLLGIKDGAAARMGEVTIACVPSAVYYFLPQVIRRYRERFPKVRVRIHDASANEVLATVARNEADFGLNFVGSQEADIEFQPLLEERFVAACPRDHPLARRRSVTWKDLAAHDFMTVSKSSGNRLLIDQALAGAPVRPQSLYEAQHVTTLLGLVEAGLGVAAVPSLAMPGRDHPLLVSVPIHDPAITRVVGLIRRRGRSLSPAAQHLHDFMAEVKGRPAARRPTR